MPQKVGLLYTEFSMKKSPLVTIVIPTYNEAKNIKRLLLSIQNQIYKNSETIVVDDASTDKTVFIAKKYANKVFSRMHAERSVQRNYGASKAKGEYLFFLDADMELTPHVLEDCISLVQKNNAKVIVIPEKTVGEGFLSSVRRFEREMYMGDPTVEVARFFELKAFNEFSGYDAKLTGPEDYDLPYRMLTKHKLFRANHYILHHEKQISLWRLLKRKYYYAKKGAYYATKHPELIKTQGNLLFRKAYITHWRNFIKHPLLGVSFIFIRMLETLAAILGYIDAVGFLAFAKSVVKLLS